jgi:hypothetical protein
MARLFIYVSKLCGVNKFRFTLGATRLVLFTQLPRRLILGNRASRTGSSRKLRGT